MIYVHKNCQFEKVVVYKKEDRHVLFYDVDDSFLKILKNSDFYESYEPYKEIKSHQPDVKGLREAFVVGDGENVLWRVSRLGSESTHDLREVYERKVVGGQWKVMAQVML